MCGIVGIIHRGSTGNIGGEMSSMLQSLRHRGPDSTGFAVYGVPRPDEMVMRFKLAEQEETRHGFAIVEQLRRISAGRPPDNLVLDGVELGECLGLAFFGFKHVIDVFLGDTVAKQSPFHVVDRTLFERTLAGILLKVEDIADTGRRCVADHIGAIAEGGRIDDLRDEAVADDQVAEIVGCR